MNWVFLDRLEKRVLRVTRDGRVRLGRLGWRGFRVPWGRLDPQDHLDHRGHRTALVLEAMMDLR